MARLGSPSATSAEDVALARGQRDSSAGGDRPARRAQLTGDDPGHRRGEVHLAVARGADRRRDVVGPGVLEQEAGGARLDGRHDPLLLDRAGERDDLDLRARRRQLAGRLDAVEPRQVEVHDHDVRAERLGRAECLAAVGRLADHLDVLEERQELAQTTADHGVVVDEEHASGRTRAHRCADALGLASGGAATGPAGAHRAPASDWLAGGLAPPGGKADPGERDADLAEHLDRDEEADEQEEHAKELPELEELGGCRSG